ncbi:MAG: Xaa-Pro peptidase family protein [Solirubrobacterales bacterium]
MSDRSSADHGARLARLREQLVERELDQLLVTNLVNIHYLTGFTGTNAMLVIGADSASLLTDFRYTGQAAEQAPGFDVLDGGSEPREVLVGLLAAVGGRAGFDDVDMRVKTHVALVELLADAAELTPAAGVVEDLRAIKGADEIESIAAAASIADSIYETLAEEGLAGRSEREVARRVELLAHERGAEGLSFPPIVAGGAHGALPHAEPRDVQIERGQLVVLDLGVVVDRYCSDATRTFASGPISDEAKEIYEIVAAAQLAALAAIAAGVECKAVDAAARDEIEAAGHGERFGHSTGHGVGLEVHEQPTLAARSTSTLQPGHVVTAEPGIYIEGKFGVRIEDLVVVTAEEPRVLTNVSKELLVVG